MVLWFFSVDPGNDGFIEQSVRRKICGRTVKVGGGNFLNEKLTHKAFSYNTFNFYLNATFLPFFEVAVTNTALKNSARTKFINQDRAICLRLRLLKERKYWPSIAIGSNDAFTQVWGGAFTSSEKGNKYFGTTYLALSKHFALGNSDIGAHAAYNVLLSNDKATMEFPISCGVSFSPGFYRKMNVIVEYDTDDVNLGANAVIFRHVFLQCMLQRFKYISAGLCLQFYWK